MRYTVSRMPGGISISGDEYARDEEGNILFFSSIIQAQDYLLWLGIPEEKLDCYCYCGED